MITIAAAGTLTLATLISVAGGTLPASAAASPADAYLTSAGAKAAGQTSYSAGGSGSPHEAVIFSKTRVFQAERQQQAAVEKAAAAKAAKAAKAKADAAKAAKARAAANAAVKAKKAAVTIPSGSPQRVAKQMLGQFGWSGRQFSCLSPLWEHESGWSLTAQNPSSGAYGIPQALPGSQMATAGGDWRTNAATQVKWGLTYIQGRYGSPCGAWAHEQSVGWY
jgi:hypothetical protein